ncbi:hypothetical protein WA171_005628 [Blastocystis sp. BT1]
MAATKGSVLLAKNVLIETTKTGDQVLMECGRAAYTTARSVFHTKVFRLSQHIDRLYNSVSGLFPEEQKNLNITREEVQNTVLENVRRARDYLCKVNPSILKDKLDVKFSVIIEKPTTESRLPVSVLIQPMTKCHQPPIICDLYHVVRSNAVVKDSLWVKQREVYYQKSGKSVEEILLSENGLVFEGGQSNFFAVKNGTVYTKGEGILQGTVRNLVLTICEKLGIPLCLEAPRVDEIPLWDACFITSTSRFVMNIDTLREDGKVLKEFEKDNKIVESIKQAIDDELKVEYCSFYCIIS